MTPSEALKRSRTKLLCVAGAVLLALAIAFATGGASRSQAAADGCISTLPVSWSASSNYAASWTKRLRLNLRTKGPTIRGLTVTLSTFGGDILGRGKVSSPLRSAGRVTIKLHFPMQAGPYTLYFLGYPNANPSCGPKHRSSVIRLVGCRTPLPIKIAHAPEGSADSYQGRYSFDISDPSGVLMKNLYASMSTVTGQLLGNVRIPVVFGDVHVSVPLNAALEPSPQRYTVDVSGFPPGRPRSCGAGQATRTVSFK